MSTVSKSHGFKPLRPACKARVVSAKPCPRQLVIVKWGIARGVTGKDPESEIAGDFNRVGPRARCWRKACLRSSAGSEPGSPACAKRLAKHSGDGKTNG